MKKEDLEFYWEIYRDNVSSIERNFVKINKGKYSNYFELEAALNKELKRLLKNTREKMMELQVSIKLRRQPLC